MRLLPLFGHFPFPFSGLRTRKNETAHPEDGKDSSRTGNQDRNLRFFPSLTNKPVEAGL